MTKLITSLRACIRTMSTKPSSTIPSAQSSNQPDRPMPNATSDTHDADTYGEVPAGREGQQRNKTEAFTPKVVEEFSDNRAREIGDDHASK